MTDIETYKTMINKYYLIGYKWKDNILPMVSLPNKQFMKFNKTIETIDVLVAYSYFKIVNINIYYIEANSNNNNANNIEKYNKMILDFITNKNQDSNENKDKIKQISIKIIENDKIFTISDDNYNIFSIDNEKVKYFITNYLEKLTTNV